jgi:cob(I)alamin adenosyltransferase
MKIYTKTGDKGFTSLYDGTKVAKSHEILNCLGNVDELNCEVGYLMSYLKNEKKLATTFSTLLEIQSILFDLGANIANPSDKKPICFDKDNTYVDKLEKEIDNMTFELSKLTNFILPGGSVEMSIAHKARTICRRAERSLVEVNEKFPMEKNSIIYLNRLSDYLFTVARYIGLIQGVEEIIYVSNVKK